VDPRPVGGEELDELRVVVEEDEPVSFDAEEGVLQLADRKEVVIVEEPVRLHPVRQPRVTQKNDHKVPVPLGSYLPDLALLRVGEDEAKSRGEIYLKGFP
jgi:hypothetical protein